MCIRDRLELWQSQCREREAFIGASPNLDRPSRQSAQVPDASWCRHKSARQPDFVLGPDRSWLLRRGRPSLVGDQ
eukprot:9220269-Pyramimonas_sp.AAC.1